MKSNINTSTNKKDILGQYISKIYDAEIWEGKELWKVAEVTYSYTVLNKKKGKYLNQTLFGSIGGLDIKTYKIQGSNNQKVLLQKAFDNTKKIIEKKAKLIKESIQEVQNLTYQRSGEYNLQSLERKNNEEEIFQLKRDIFVKSLMHSQYLLESALLGLPFEGEKAGLEHNLSEKKIQDRIKKLDENDTILFGGKINKEDNEKEIIRCYEYLQTEYNKNKAKLSPDEQKDYYCFLERVKDLLPKGYVFKEYREPKKVTLSSINIHTPRKEYVQNFNRYFDSHQMSYLAEEDPHVSSITDEENSLKFPMTEKTNFLKLERLLELKAHESDAHGINLFNGKEILGNIRGARNIEKEEGLAMLLEYLFIYGENAYSINSDGKNIIDAKKVNIKPQFPKMLFAEILTGDKLLKYLHLHDKIEKDTTTPLARFLRLKRNRPLDYPGCQHKDTTYIRGIFRTLEYINTGKDPQKLFLGKVGFDDIDTLAKIKKLREENGEEITLIKPVMMYEQIYFKLLKNFGGKKYSKLDFVTYLHKKYPFINISTRDTRGVSRDIKENIIAIIHNYKENIENNKKIKE